MKIIRVSYSNQKEAAMIAIDMSNWCKENGLRHSYDFDWALITKDKEIHFRFYSDSESYSTLFALKWAGYEV